MNSHHNLQKPAAIFFDWDGTLVDSLAPLHAYYNHVMAHFGREPITTAQAKQNIRRSAREVFPELFGAQSPEAMDVFYACVADKHLEQLSPFSDSPDFVRFLSTLSIPMGIVSNKRHSYLMEEITHLGWNSVFTANVGAGMAARDKPSPDPLVMAIQKAGLDPSSHHIWYIGDTETDIQTAVAAHCTPIFIEHGMGTQDDLAKYNLHPYCVKDLRELAELVQKFF